MDRRHGKRVERGSWASFKVKLAIICSLVVAGMLGLMFLEMTEEERKRGSVRDLVLLQRMQELQSGKRGRGRSEHHLGPPLSLSLRSLDLSSSELSLDEGITRLRRQQMRRRQILHLGAAVNFQPSFPPHIQDEPDETDGSIPEDANTPQIQDGVGSMMAGRQMDQNYDNCQKLSQLGVNCGELYLPGGKNLQNLSGVAFANATNDAYLEEYSHPFSPVEHFWATGDVQIAPGEANPSHLIQTDNKLPDYRPEFVPLNETKPKGPPGFLGLFTDANNVTLANWSGIKLDKLGVNTGEEPWWSDTVTTAIAEDEHDNAYLFSPRVEEWKERRGSVRTPAEQTARGFENFAGSDEASLGPPVDFDTTGTPGVTRRRRTR